MKWSEHLNDSFTRGQSKGRIEAVVTTIALTAAIAAGKFAIERFRESELADKADRLLWKLQGKWNEVFY
jgi:hypothetical protein